MLIVQEADINLPLAHDISQFGNGHVMAIKKHGLLLIGIVCRG